MYIWKDVSSYSQNDKKRIPSCWRIDVKDFISIKVHRHIYYENTWFLSCKELNLDMVDLMTDNVEQAKNQALILIEKRCTDLLEKVNGFLHNINP